MQKLKDAKLRADQSEIAFCHHEGYCRARFNGEKMLETHLEIEADELEDEVLLQALPFFESLDTKVQRRLKRAALGPPAGEEQEDKAAAKRRKKTKKAAAVLKQGKQDLQQLLQKHNRKEILQGMVPSAGGSKLGSFAAKMKLSLSGLLQPGKVQTKAAAKKAAAKKAAAKKPAAEKAAPKKPAAPETAEQESAGNAEHRSSKKHGGKGKLQKKASNKALEKKKKKKALKKALKQLEEVTEVAGAAPAAASAPAAAPAAAPRQQERRSSECRFAPSLQASPTTAGWVLSPCRLGKAVQRHCMSTCSLECRASGENSCRSRAFCHISEDEDYAESLPCREAEVAP